MYRIISLSIISILNIVLQSTLFEYIEILNIKPNTSILIIISYAMLRGDIEGSILGFFSGLMQDILFGKVVGLNALMGFILGFVCGKPFKDFYTENYFIPIFMAFIGTFIYGFVFYLVNFLFRGRLDAGNYLSSIVIPETVYTTVLMFFVYRFIYAVNDKLTKKEASKRKLF